MSVFVREAGDGTEGTEPWLGLEFRHLAALQAVADEGSFNGAARRLGYTQSAISQQIASLERIVGMRVVERVHGKKTLGLSVAGETLLAHATAIQARLGRGEDRHRRARPRDRGPVADRRLRKRQHATAPGDPAQVRDRFPGGRGSSSRRRCTTSSSCARSSAA